MLLFSDESLIKVILSYFIDICFSKMSHLSGGHHHLHQTNQIIFFLRKKIKYAGKEYTLRKEEAYFGSKLRDVIYERPFR